MSRAEWQHKQTAHTVIRKKSHYTKLHERSIIAHSANYALHLAIRSIASITKIPCCGVDWLSLTRRRYPGGANFE